jgi:phosphatidylinositol kinase/protein kinase (PI-3  family)
MLVKAMEVSGIEGSYRSTCERTMTVLRDNRDSLVAMLEAFVYDPLISWRLVGLSESASHADSDKGASNLQGTNSMHHNDTVDERIPGGRTELGRGQMNQTNTVLQDSIAEGFDEDDNDAEEAFTGDENASVSQRLHAGIALRANSMSRDAGVSASRARSLQMYSSMQEMSANLSRSSRIASIAGAGSAHVAQDGSMARSRIARSLRQRELMGLFEGQDSAAHEESVNEKALKVIRRVQDKLSGTDFCDMDDTNEPLDVTDQVQRLIVQATSIDNLCQLFIGW